MSTDHQKYSIRNQTQAIALYAAARGYEIVRTYSDEGLSGLGIRRRAGLQALLADVLGGSADFDMIVTYDVSRWGRFQDPDQAAHYEYLCRDAGVSIEYCAEAFDNDGSLATTLLKNLKRAMAADFSRDLSARVSAVQELIAKDGFWVGGPAGFGLRRRIVASDGTLGLTMDFGEHKALQDRRVILVPGPPDEVATVRRIYRLFVTDRLTLKAIARRLNGEGVMSEGGRPWTTQRVGAVLRAEKYAGENVFGKVHRRLDNPAVRQPRANWIRVPGAFEAIVPRALFDRAQALMSKVSPNAPDEVMLANLAGLLAREGRLSGPLISGSPFTHCAHVYRERFGSLLNAYRLVGYEPDARQVCSANTARAKPAPRRPRMPEPTDAELLQSLAGLLAEKGRLTGQLIDDAPHVPNAYRYVARFGGMRRAYALVGYEPNAAQARAMAHQGGQSITVAEASALARSVRDSGLPFYAAEPDPADT
jgi:DNA invertase Pin-like site-specific DNA recombinase